MYIILLTSVVTLTMKEHSLIAATRVDLTDLFTERYMYISQSYTLGGELKDSEICTHLGSSVDVLLPYLRVDNPLDLGIRTKFTRVRTAAMGTELSLVYLGNVVGGKYSASFPIVAVRTNGVLHLNIK